MSEKVERFKTILISACRSCYGGDLITLAIFGSWARGTAHPESDMDLLVVAAHLPGSRGKRMRQFLAIDEATDESRRSFWGPPHPPLELSPVIKTPQEVSEGSPLFLDMTDNLILLTDVGGFMAGYLDGLRQRMAGNGTVRIPAKGGYY